MTPGEAAVVSPPPGASSIWTGASGSPVRLKGSYPIATNEWSEVAFDPVSSSALRLVVKLQPDWAAGLHEWKVLETEEE